MKTSLIILTLTLKLVAQPQVIDCGSPTDTGFLTPPGFTSTAYTIPSPVPASISDPTMRYGQQFTYHIALTGKPGLYALVLSFVEPTVQGPGLRVFSVTANDQPIIQNLDLVATAGYLVPTTRSFPIYIFSGDLTIVFTASVRNAVVSSISLLGLGFGAGQTNQ